MSNVVNMFEFKKKKQVEADEIENDPDVQEYLKKVEEKNKENSERQKLDRAQHNKKVTREYNLKD